MQTAMETRQFEVARSELHGVLNHPRLIEYLRENPKLFDPFHKTIRLYLGMGKVDEARTMARRVLDLAILLKIPRGESHYYLARACAMKGRSDPEALTEAAKQFYNAFAANPDFRSWYQIETDFDPVRLRIDAALQRMEDPAKVRRRLVATSLVQ